MRLSYPGITKLVVVKSVYNDTPAGRKAIDAVASYYSALATATASGTIEPARRLAGPGCAQCQLDINRIGGYVSRHERIVRTDGSPIKWLTASIFIESVSGSGVASVQFDGSQPAVRLIRASGSVIATNAGALASDLDTVQIDDSRPTIIDLRSR